MFKLGLVEPAHHCGLRLPRCLFGWYPHALGRMKNIECKGVTTQGYFNQDREGAEYEGYIDVYCILFYSSNGLGYIYIYNTYLLYSIRSHYI